jgi:hypothetical protein
MKCGECEHSKAIQTGYSAKFCRLTGFAYPADHKCHIEDKPQTYKLTIPVELTDLNTYIDAERTHRMRAADIKKTMTNICCLYAKNYARLNGLETITKRVKLIFTWYCKNQMKDPSNVCFAKKFVEDGLVAAGVLKDDGWKNIAGFEDYFAIDKDKPRVEIQIVEIGEV